MYYLWVLAPKSMPIQIEWITASLGPSSVQLALPLNSIKRPEMPAAWAGGNKVVQKNLVKLLHSPLFPFFCWNGKLLPKIFCYPFCKLRWKPTKDGVSSAVRVSNPLGLSVISTRDKTPSRMSDCFVSSSFEQVNIQALFTIVVDPSCRTAFSSPGFAPLCLFTHYIPN